ncbi:MAG: ABC transporter substrate-binding protein [Alphaproteobacteria bacterium]|nr:ABC transporter substrate-binding protein [Alphaproteobacteria bacterium]
MHRPLRLAAATLALALLHGPMPAQAQAPAASMPPLRVGLLSDIDTLDPVMSNTIAGRSVLQALCDKLIDIDADLRFVPRLATAWEWSEDQKVLTLRLRAGVTFHDGEPFNAEAVRFNIERALTMPGSRRRSEVVAIEQVEVAEPLVARLHLRAPFAPLLSQLADRAGMMVSPKAAQAPGATFGTRPVCSGPFALVAHVPQDRIELRRFEQHWDATNVRFGSVVFRPVPDSTVRLLNLRAGSLDLIERVAANDVAEVRRDNRLRYAESTGLGFTSIIVNTGSAPRAQNPLGRDARVRQAFDMAIDREALNQVAFAGANRPGNQSVAPNSPFYFPGERMRPRDLAGARRLLAEAQAENLRVDLMVPNTTEFMQVAEIIQAMVKEAGFDLRIDATELATAARRMTGGDFQAFLIGWSGRLDPDGNIYAFNHCQGTNNDSKFCDPRVDIALDAARATTDQARRIAHYHEAATIYLPARHRLYLFHESWRFAHSARLQGFRAPPDGILRIPGLGLN